MSQTTLLLDALLLKELPRAGWLRVPVDNPESVAAHSWGVAWLALLLCPAHLNRERVLTLSIVHDLPEVHAGDITPHDGVTRDEKRHLERAAAERLFQGRPDLLAAWEEYEANNSPEARFVHQLDKLDMGLQAIRYARDQQANTDEFLHSALKRLEQQLQTLLREASTASTSLS